MACEHSITGQYLSGKKRIDVPLSRRKGNGHVLSVRGAAANNLKDLDVDIPLGAFTCVTGVSGSGKSSLVNEVIEKKLGADLNRRKVRPGKCHAPVQSGHLHGPFQRYSGPVRLYPGRKAPGL